MSLAVPRLNSLDIIDPENMSNTIKPSKSRAAAVA
jgi:hypothetical protein